MKENSSDIKTYGELLACLVIFTKLQNNPYSLEALISGLPVKREGETDIEYCLDKQGKSIFSRAAMRAGLSTSITRNNLKNISPLLMPCILMLKDNKACILHKVKDGKAVITTPDVPEGLTDIEISKLEEIYTGYLWYLKRKYVTEENEPILKNREGHWFWGTIKLSKKIYIDVIFASLAINIFAIASPLFTMNVYDRVVPNNAIETLWVLAIGVFFVFSVDMILKLSRTYFLDIAAKKSDVIISSTLFEHVLDMSFENKPKNVGSYANNLKEFDTIRNFFTSSTMAVLIDLPFAFIFIAVCYFIAGSLIIIPLVLMAIMLIYALAVKNPLQNSIKETFEASAKKNGILIESLNGLETIKTMGSMGRTQYIWEESTGEIASKSTKTKFLSASLGTFTQFLVQVNTIGVIIYGVYKMQSLEITMGALIATVMLSSRAIAPIGQSASLIANYEQTKTAYNSLKKIMESDRERPSGKKFVRRDNISGNIEFENVVFSYEKEGSPILNNISFKIKAGEKVGIIGKNGSGKTTIEKLILGLYKPVSGRILIDGIDINQIDPVDLRKTISYVPQDVILFNGTIRSNIVQKAPWASDEELIYASKISGADEYVNNSSKGFDTPIYERGDGISGGQKQAVAIARAFLTKSSIIILDEPTSSLDVFAEERLKKSIKNSLNGETLILVSHNLSLLNLVDRLIVIDRGKIISDGSRTEIMNRYLGR